jgi:hypothetical protein
MRIQNSVKAKNKKGYLSMCFILTKVHDMALTIGILQENFMKSFYRLDTSIQRTNPFKSQN